MPVYARTPSNSFEVVDRWDDGFGWLAHPDEEGLRASHAVRGEEGVWLVDPVDARGIDDHIADLGDVVGVAVLFNWHARDAGTFADRYDVAVHVPEWMDRVQARVDAPIDRYSRGFDDFEVRRYAPIPGWNEALAYRERDGTLVVGDALGTAPGYVASDERVGVPVVMRLWPPREHLRDCEPERILCGHGRGVFEDASTALDDALTGARRRLPRALGENLGTQLRSLYEATTD